MTAEMHKFQVNLIAKEMRQKEQRGASLFDATLAQDKELF